MYQRGKLLNGMFLCVYAFLFFLNFIQADISYEVCNWHFQANILQKIFDKYNQIRLEGEQRIGEEDVGSSGDKIGKGYLDLGGQRKKSDCNNLNTFNPVRTFWNLKIKALCTEKTSILDKSVLNKICSKKYETPYLVIEGVKVNNTYVNLEFICAHFLYNNDREIIKCIKNNILKNYLDSYHIAFDLYVSKNVLKLYSKVENEFNIKELKSLSLNKNIVDESLCRIHSEVYNVMNEEEYLLLKTLMGLCTKLGFHKHFLITDNIHPLFNPLANRLPYNFTSLHLNIENTSMFYTHYDYFLYNLKFTEFDYTINASMSPVVLRLAENNSFFAWAGFTQGDKGIYETKFAELYELLKKIKYIERINSCYNKYTYSFYDTNKNYFQKYLSPIEKQELKANENIYIYIISSICKNIPTVHKCVEKIISLNGIYDNFFKNFMINFIYYNSSCVFNCSHVDVGKMFNDDNLWHLFIKYLTHSYLVRYKKKRDNYVNVSTKKDGSANTEYEKLMNSYYKNYDYRYIHSGQWRKEMESLDEEDLLKPSNHNIEYEFYNYTFHLIDLNTYNFFILKNEVQEDTICKIASFIQENGKKYVHVNKYIEHIFNSSGRFLSDVADSGHTNGLGNNGIGVGSGSGAGIGEGGNDSGLINGEGNGNNDVSGKKNGQAGFNFLDNFLDDFKGGNFLNMFKNNDFLSDGKLLDYVMKHAGGGDHSGSDNDDISDDDYDDYDDYDDLDDDIGNEELNKTFNRENFKLETKYGPVYPLEKSYDYKHLLSVFEMHPRFQEQDRLVRRKFFTDPRFLDSFFFQINGIPTKIPDFYKHYYEIKKNTKMLTSYEEKHYKHLIAKSKEDPDIFSKINISFGCSKSGKWPVRNSAGNWVSDVLCEAYYIPQMIVNHAYEKQNLEQKKNENAHKENEDGDTKAQVESSSAAKKALPYIIKGNTRLIGIEFEDQEPYRCVISYLGDETYKTIVPISAATVLKAAVGFCILHGFKIVWVADSAFDPITDIYMKYTSVLEKGKAYYELLKFELYGQTRMVPKIEYIASGINLKNDIITSAIYKNKYSVIGFPGTDLKFMIFMSRKIKNMIYNLKFDCHQWAYSGCSEYYPLMKKIRLHSLDKKYDKIILPSHVNVDESEKEDMYKCAFMHDPTFIELNKLFPRECTFGSRIGDCHNKVRTELPCYDKSSCKYLIYIYEQFYKPSNHVDSLNEHFIKVSEQLSRLAKPYFIQSVMSLEQDTQIKKYNKQNTEYENIMLFILKNSVYYISWCTSSEFWKRAVYVQDGSTDSPYQKENNDNNSNNKNTATSATNNNNTNSEGKQTILGNNQQNMQQAEFFCPVAYAHEFIKHMFNQYMKFPNM